MSLSTWIASTAFRLCPHDRAEWARAMEAEIATLETNRLRWALGCLAVCIGWRLQADAFYLASLALTCWFLASGVWFLPVMGLAPNRVWQPYLAIGLYPNLVLMVLLCLALSYYRPDRVVMTALTILLITFTDSWYDLFVLMGSPPSVPGWTVDDARPLIGLSAEFGAGLTGGLIGRALSPRRAARRS